MKFLVHPSVEKVVYLVRHGESEDNTAQVFQAEDSPLSSIGKAQAKIIGERAAALSFEKIIASPLPRAKSTALEIAERTGKPITYSDLFVERIKPSSISGKPYSDTVATETWRSWNKTMFNGGRKVEDGENYEEIISRANNALDYLMQTPGRELLVVTHGYFMRALIGRVILADQLTPQIFSQIQKIVAPENTAISVLNYKPDFEQDGCWRLQVYNDHAHLGEV